MATVSPLIWVLTLLGLMGLVMLDFFLTRNPRDVSFKEAIWWSVLYTAVAVVFGVGVWYWMGHQSGVEFFTAYMVERSLSIDNLFVFVVILARFAVPSVLSQRVLLIGVVLALIFRTVFIVAGVAALNAFSFTFILFGVLLIWTGVQLARHHDEDPDPKDNLMIRVTRKWVPFTPEYHGNAVVVKGSTVGMSAWRVATPLLLVMLAIGSTDVLFALDSIPATFGVTTDLFLVFTVNAFSLLGMRALYFLIAGLLDRLVYLSLGLAVILSFIGVKLILEFFGGVWESVPKIPTVWSLVFIALVLVVTGVASWLKVRKDPDTVMHAGRLGAPDSPEPDVNGPDVNVG